MGLIQIKPYFSISHNHVVLFLQMTLSSPCIFKKRKALANEWLKGTQSISMKPSINYLVTHFILNLEIAIACYPKLCILCFSYFFPSLSPFSSSLSRFSSPCSPTAVSGFGAFHAASDGKVHQVVPTFHQRLHYCP